MKVSVKFEGIDELQLKIAYLSGSDARKVLGEGAAAGAKVVLRKAKPNAPGSKKLGYKVFRHTNVAVSLVRPIRGHWYYKFRENGSKAHGPKKTWRKFLMWRENGKKIIAKRVRGIQARPFLRPALENNLQEVQDAMLEGYRKMLDKVSK